MTNPSYSLAGVLIKTPDPGSEAQFWSKILSQPVEVVTDGPAGAEFTIRSTGDLPLFFGRGPQKPPTVMGSQTDWSGKSSAHICWASNKPELVTERLAEQGATVEVSADRGISFLVFTSPDGHIDGCLLDAQSWDEEPPDSWKRPVDDDGWVAMYYLTIDAPDVVPAATDNNSISEYGHGISANWWRELIGGKLAPYEGEAAGSFPYYVPLVDTQSSCDSSHPVLFQRVQDGTHSRPLDCSWVVPVLTPTSAASDGVVLHKLTVISDPYGNEAVIWAGGD